MRFELLKCDSRHICLSLALLSQNGLLMPSTVLARIRRFFFSCKYFRKICRVLMFTDMTRIGKRYRGRQNDICVKWTSCVWVCMHLSIPWPVFIIFRIQCLNVHKSQDTIYLIIFGYRSLRCGALDCHYVTTDKEVLVSVVANPSHIVRFLWLMHLI